ncbi:MAG: class I SAM-dependent methyltransferase [Steroidobacteraceae bacterium]
MTERFTVINVDRSSKARMIQAILSDHLQGPVAGYRTLDIGCGNGGISESFASTNEHYAVDIKDQRHNTAATYDFHLVASERLPFGDGFFDIVVSHHVIEHVSDQHLHLAEIRRVLKPHGIAYLATPNRTSPIMKGHVGNDRVLGYRAMLAIIREHGFAGREFGSIVVKEPDRFHAEIRYGRFLPLFLIRLLRPLFPSQMFVLRKVTR